MARSTYIVCYDISDDRRRYRIAEICRGYGDRIQYSVFQANLTRSERHTMAARLRDELKHDEDQVLFINLGPAEGRAAGAITAIGRLHHPPDDGPVIV